jgi:1,4-dihydroxy-6-naphthoate synthase
MKLTLGYSPCPNDTFIFDALVNGGVDTKGLQFEPVLEDVETLNQWAGEGRLDITKLSLPALFQHADSYQILNSGAALGQGVGPLLVAKNKINLEDTAQYTVAIPGHHTTANFLLSFAFPFLTRKKAMVFSEIEEAVLSGAADLGILIHENRFTYQKRGLHKIADLGDVWEEKQKSPIPLGCIAAKKILPTDVQRQVDTLIRQSLEKARANYPQVSPYVRQHAQAMDEAVMRSHIDLYVNEFSIDLGSEGKAAIEKLHEVYCRQNGMTPTPLFNGLA